MYAVHIWKTCYSCAMVHYLLDETSFDSSLLLIALCIITVILLVLGSWSSGTANYCSYSCPTSMWWCSISDKKYSKLVEVNFTVRHMLHLTSLLLLFSFFNFNEQNIKLFLVYSDVKNLKFRKMRRFVVRWSQRSNQVITIAFNRSFSDQF